MFTRTSARRRSLRASVAVLALATAIVLPLTPLDASAAHAVAADQSTAVEPTAAPEPTPAPVEPEVPADPAPTAEPMPSAVPEPTETTASDPAEPTEPAAPSDAEAPASPVQTAAPSPVAQARVAAAAPSASIGTMALNAPEPAVEAPFLHWRTSPAQSGATFEIERRTLTRRWFFGYYWEESNWTGAATVADCTAVAQCATTGDLDPDRGEFQVTHAGSSHRIPNDTTTTRYEYRVRPAGAPSGYQWTDTEWRVSSANDRIDGVGDLGTFELGTNSALSCTSGTFYSLATTGVVNQVTRSGSGATITQVGEFPGVAAGAQMNSLGIGLGGTVMYAAERASGTSSGLAAIHRYSVASGWQRTALSNVATDTSIVLGGVNLADGRYYFGGYRVINGTTSFQLYVYDPATAAVTPRGTFATNMSGTSNGDLAFDLFGNLYVVQSLTDGNTRIYTVTAAAVAAGGTMPVSSSPAFAGLSGTNGMAFEGDGTVYLGTGTTARIYDPSTGALRAGTVTTSLSASGDLASCLSPATLTIRKNVVGRVASGDAFTLSVIRGGTTLGSALANGPATGIQTAQVGPLTALSGQAYTIQETISANAGSYTSSYTCVDETGTTVASGSARSGTVTIPNRSGASVVCTFRNAPLVTAVVVRKLVENIAGTEETPGAGWSLTARAQATTGTVASTPTAGTQTANAAGEARWNLQFGAATARASIAVSETQQQGYAFVEGACLITTIEGSTSTVALPDAQGATLTGVAPGSSIVCTIVNRVLPTTLTLVKSVSFGAEAATSWTLRATGPQSARTGPSGVTGSAQATAAITPGAAYRLSESGGPATYVQAGAWRCLDELAATVAVTPAGDVTVARSGAQVTCTVTNQTARLTLLKSVVNDNGGSITAAQFPLTATPASSPVISGLGGFTVTGAGTVVSGNTREVRPGHAYALTEDMGQYAYLGQSIQRYTGPANPAAAQLANAANWQTLTAAQAAAVSVPAGQHAIYRFVNDDAPALALPLTGGIGADTYLFGGAGVLLLGLLTAAALLVRTRIRSSREARLT
ncbi:hypothetical protein [Agrococcus sp. Ld7]|uniref:prealbumin-like fold domain-containing protein n=1 Tax=Agrococcus sp. Ld7 TaxID=649148 RepID=UPI003864C3AB